MIAQLLLDAVAEIPGGGEGTLITGLLGLTTALLSAYTLTQKGRLDDMRNTNADLKLAAEKAEERHERDLAIERARTDRSDKREEAVFEQMGKTVATVTDLSSAVRDFATIGQTTVQEVKKVVDRQDTILRRQDGIERSLNDLAYPRRSYPPGTSDDR